MVLSEAGSRWLNLFFALGLLRHRQLLAVEDSTDQLGSDPVSKIHANNNSNGPFLPLPVPIEGDGHSAKPCAEQGAQKPARRFIQRRISSSQRNKSLPIHTADVEDRKEREKGEMRSAV